MVTQTCGKSTPSEVRTAPRIHLRRSAASVPMECMSPLSTLALSRLDMARTVQWRREARRRDIPRFRPPTAWPSSSTSLQSLSRFMKSVKYLRSHRHGPEPEYTGAGHGERVVLGGAQRS